MDTIKQALISVSDKTGLVDFVRVLHGLGISVLSTGAPPPNCVKPVCP